MKKNCVLAAVLCLPLFSATHVMAQERREVPEFRVYGQPTSVEYERAVNGLVQSFKDAWANQDAAALTGLHASDTEWINAYARLIRGAQPLGKFLKERLFPAFDPAISREEVANMRTISIRFLGDEAAVVHLYTEGRRGASRNSGEETRRTHMHLVLEQQASNWKIVHTAIMDAR